MKNFNIQQQETLQKLLEIPTMYPSYTMDIIRSPEKAYEAILKTDFIVFKTAIPVSVPKHKDQYVLVPMNMKLLNANSLLQNKLEEFFQMCNHVMNTHKPTPADVSLVDFQEYMLIKDFGKFIKKGSSKA